MAPFNLLTFALAVQFGKKNTWATAPIAKVTVTARGPVCAAVVKMHVLEAKQAVAAMLQNRTGFDENDIDNIEVEVHKRILVDDEHASISTNIVMSMTCGALTVMN